MYCTNHLQAFLHKASIALLLLLISGSVYAHTIEIVTPNPSSGRPITAHMEGMAPWVSPWQEAYVELEGSTVYVYGTIGYGIAQLLTPYEFQVSLGSLPPGDYEVVYFGRFEGDPEYQEWDSVALGVGPILPVPALSYAGLLALGILLVLMASVVLRNSNRFGEKQP